MFQITADGIVLFGLKIYYYALVIITGVILAAVISTREAKRHGYDPDKVWDMLPWLLIAGIVGARIWHVFTPSSTLLIDGKNPYFIHPLQIFNIRQGGLGIPGAVMAGVLALWFYCRKNKFSFVIWLDVIAPGLALAQAVGRWGNFFNQEIYGLPTTATKFPLAIFIDEAHRLPEHLQHAYYLPTFFYEFLWNLINMALLLILPRKLGDRMKPGDNFLVYLIVYPIGRFFLEFIRLEYSPIAGININQTVMAVIAVCAAIALVLRHVIKKKDSTQEASDTEDGAFV